ncbi:sensor domain-containing diguanylate cyclase [Halalkalibacter nanhaiisediminis]|uniref:Diguanylate cyclase (GGDEF)-like protein n=1 Tax=Halalkalibacter nanhaiisediminis TaxID=688079 RepID=A0A562QMV4_9BACI|nr:sensor domain-containing diguanylate cyclase [Halalkalibacter nanhaiisediminis]TWI58091.1 diguanylate cyclase (GGDEF)-like protein [Halalkalibacter nanhaiisediminis]
MVGKYNIHNEVQFAKIAQDILEMANQLIGNYSYFISYMDKCDFRVLKVLTNGEILLKEGLILPIEESYCHYIYEEKKPLVLSDSMKNDRTKYLKITTDANIGSYAGVPIILKNGTIFGSLCTLDAHPITHNTNTVEILERLASFLSYAIELELSTMKDPMTGIYNRLFWKRLLLQLKNEEGIHTFMLLDVDSFKVINDTLGHEKGDEVIVKIGNLLQNSIPENAFAFRFGGDEFGVLFPDLSLEQARPYAIDIKNKGEQIQISEKEISFSIGIVDTSCIGLEDIMNQADKLLYQSKKNGKNCISQIS